MDTNRGNLQTNKNIWEWSLKQEQLVASNKIEAKTKTDKLKDQTKEKYNLT